MMPMRSYLDTGLRLLHDWVGAARHCADYRSVLRLGCDFTLSRVLHLIPKASAAPVRQIRLKRDVRLCYRLDKGDLHSIREVWFDEAYRLPFEVPPGTALDLGANIGLTSLWLAKHHRIDRVIAVEPDPSNARLVKQNLELNGIDGEVIEAAIAGYEGTGMLLQHRSSNLGHLSNHGLPVQITTVNAIVKAFGCSKFSVVKIDIEGSEQSLFEGPSDWLDQTGQIIIELHPAVVDCSKICNVLANRGFKYIQANSVFRGNMDCFVRQM